MYAKRRLRLVVVLQPSDDRLSLSAAFPSWDAQCDSVTKLLFFIKGIFKTYTLDKLTDGLVSNAEAWRFVSDAGRILFAADRSYAPLY